MNGNESMLSKWMERWRSDFERSAESGSEMLQRLAMDTGFEQAIDLADKASQERVMRRQFGCA